ncbi:reverse transcriptase domain-containing protein [Tanacetum coccineum]
MQEVILFYNGLGIPTRHILDSRGAIPSKTTADVKVAIQEMAEYSQKSHNGTSRNNANPSYQERRQSMEDTLSKFMSESAKRHEENSNLIKEIQVLTDAAIRNQRALIKTLEIQIGQMIKNRTLMYETRQTKIPFQSRLNGYYCEERKGSYGPQFLKAYSKASHIENSIPRKEKDPGRASISVMPLSTYLNLGLGELAHTKLAVELAVKTVKYPKGITKNVLVGIGKFVFLVDFIILDMPEDIQVPLILERPFLSTAHAQINNQGDDLIPTIKEGEVIKEFKTRDDDLDIGIDDYPRFEFTHANFFLLLYVNVMSKKFHNSIMKDKMVYKENNVVGALMNVPIFVGTFSVVTDFAVLENIDAYRDKGWAIVTYQMVRSYPRSEHHTNEQCNKILPFLKVSNEDKKNGISHPYQKLKGFYKGVLNLGPDYIRDAKTEEWLIRGHISVHEME